MLRQPFKASYQPSASPVQIPAPLRGWNARDPIADMDRTDAIFLDNLFPRTTDIISRKGSAVFATLPADTVGDPNNIRSLISYNSPSGTVKLFAGTNKGIYNITAGGTISSVDSAATNGDWKSQNITTAGGSFVWCCNGVDKSRYYDGSAWTVLDGASSPALTGITSTDITNVSMFKSRLVFTKKSSLSFYYLSVNSVAGAAVEFPLGALFHRGGHLVATSSWTVDGGNGPDDYFVALTSEGEVAVYQGTDPSSAATWSLKGIYFVGQPIGDRCIVKLGGDLGILTRGGFAPLSKALLNASVDRSTAFSDRIKGAFTAAAEAYGENFGWQALVYSEAPFLLVNVPIVAQHDIGTVYSYQFVMNTQTGAWCRFIGMNAEAWAVHDSGLFYACHNVIYQAWTGTTDRGAAIDCRCKSAFWLPAKGYGVNVTLLQPVVTADFPIELQLGLDVDYDEDAWNASSTSYGNAIAKWDTAIWDQSVWSSGTATYAKWKSVSHKPGRAISLRLRTQLKSVTLTWIATNLIIQKGGLM